MSSRTPEQFRRLDFERLLLARFAPRFRWIDLGDIVHVEGCVPARGGEVEYQGRLVLPEGYPDQIPSLCVIQPHTLWLKGGNTTVNSLGCTHQFHTWGNGPGGCVSICHSAAWNASISCVSLVIKFAIWVTAYEAYLRTGQDVCDFVNRDRSRRPVPAPSPAIWHCDPGTRIAVPREMQPAHPVAIARTMATDRPLAAHFVDPVVPPWSIRHATGGTQNPPAFPRPVSAFR
jgi:hypothetical protein